MTGIKKKLTVTRGWEKGLTEGKRGRVVKEHL